MDLCLGIHFFVKLTQYPPLYGGVERQRKCLIEGKKKPTGYAPARQANADRRRAAAANPDSLLPACLTDLPRKDCDELSANRDSTRRLRRRLWISERNLSIISFDDRFCHSRFCERSI